MSHRVPYAVACQSVPLWKIVLGFLGAPTDWCLSYRVRP